MTDHRMRALLRSDMARSANQGLAVLITLFIVRWGQHARTRPARWLWRLADWFYLRLLLSAEIPCTLMCGEGLALPHAGRGLVINPDVVIGNNVMIFHRVTLGATAAGAPTIGDDVTIGTGACVLGPVRIGARAKVGANAVVVADVPPGASVHAAPVVVRPAPAL